ncbi:uncharacterized protein LOC17887875 [Capsella rubella]|uniref:uncharacterized protein LOC17887875 n=1 Tax=Capsella rubella TaxID=81985 RepID=UPI000CD5320E|nr:uncharacterized protein LOC17887875 [Capsella rubella]
MKNWRLSGEGINSLSFAELRSLETQLSQGLLCVEDQLAKKTLKLEEDERLLMQEAGEGEGLCRERRAWRESSGSVPADEDESFRSQNISRVWTMYLTLMDQSVP